MDRRKLIKSCSLVAVGSMFVPGFFDKVLAGEKEIYKKYNKTLLIKEDGTPITSKDIPDNTVLLFFYPYKSTPCYIINTGEEVKPTKVKLSDGKEYEFKGGIGNKKSIVAYSAICPHQWSYPTKDFSLINYYPSNQKSETTGKSGVIQCCAHISVFDVKNGGQVIEGPAELPLACVELLEEDGKIYATAVVGPNQFEEFFDMYKSDLIEQYGNIEKAKELLDKTVVMEVGKHVKEQIRC
ncbi:Rieske 2Fe-2S domain-containing protein [Sulfurihydrogenibium sp.]|uniref:Rieske 2Fe-2S domain-containing protein n=1 Tax=Sulfurihydrogenibium sp. TaxID=2053621 RepID=UPI00261F6D0B|nr:Rieske 2Fe-2S domain-containing protein [Sulfurihydrogenibium sp.]